MKIAVLNNCVPFLAGGAEYLAEALVGKLREYGHGALLVKIPFRWEPPGVIPDQILACRLMRLPNVDRAIGLKFPAYYIPHPNKVLWLLHQFRQAYDLWGTQWGLPQTSEGQRIRDAVFRADQNYLSEAVRIHTNSRVTSARLLQFNGLNSEVLYPPLLNHAAYRCEEYGDFVFCPSRINQSKRQHLLIQAMKYVRTDVRLVLAGQIETAADRALIEQLLGDPQIAARVVLLDRYISEQEKLDLFSRARACAYIPYDEDSYGYVTLEAFLSRKPVITGTDSGGTDLLVKDRLTGRIVAPDPRRIAEAMDELAADQQLAARWGTAGFELAQSLEIHWDRVIQVLTK